MCCSRDDYEEEMDYGSCSPSKQADGCRVRYTPGYPITPILCEASLPVNWDVFGGSESSQESTLKEEKNKYAHPQGCSKTMSVQGVLADYCLFASWFDYLPSDMDTSRLPPTDSIRCEWPVGTPMQGKLSALNDWATALRASHASGVVHGNLTPASVGVVHGRGILMNRGWSPGCELSWTRVAPDDDVCSARWAATELFRLDNGNPRPTRMSDVYSFGCLVLQVLTGRVPYCGTKRPEQVVYLKYLGREPIDAQTPKVEDHYVVFMRWCWSPEPENRPTMDTVVGFLHEEIKKLRG